MTGMKDDVFFDTTILVYAFDESEKRKKGICKKIVGNVFKGEGKGAVSNQVLAEFFSVITKKVEYPLRKGTAREIVNSFIGSENWLKINYNANTVKSAMFASETLNIPFWDSLIVETMRENEITGIFTENEKDFRKAHAIKVMNPLK